MTQADRLAESVQQKPLLSLVLLHRVGTNHPWLLKALRHWRLCSCQLGLARQALPGHLHAHTPKTLAIVLAIWVLHTLHELALHLGIARLGIPVAHLLVWVRVLRRQVLGANKRTTLSSPSSSIVPILPIFAFAQHASSFCYINKAAQHAISHNPLIHTYHVHLFVKMPQRHHGHNMRAPQPIGSI